MRDSFAQRGGVEYVEKDGFYTQVYPEPETEPEPGYPFELVGTVWFDFTD